MKKTSQKQDYFLGLDIGTGSVGWAVTDPAYQIINKAGKALWGVRLFEGAETAAECRAFRVNRRRGDRTVQRLRTLQELFRPAIQAVDPLFFQRLEDSKFWAEDKNTLQPNTLFNDSDYNDQNYYQDYPTIYHLRKELLSNPQPHDVRLVYLALHHMLKHRGHFLFPQHDLKKINQFSLTWNNLNKTLSEELNIKLECKDLKQLEEILSKRLKLTDKRKALEALFVFTKPKRGQNTEPSIPELIGLLGGSSVDLQKIFLQAELPEDQKDLKLSLAKEDFDSKAAVLAKALGEQFYVLEQVKAVYDWSLLADTLQGQEYLSLAKVAAYEKHQRDLALLKQVLKENNPAGYHKMFSEMGETNYSAYIGKYRSKGRKHKLAKNNKRICTKDEFYKTVKAALKDLESEAAQQILAEIEAENFLPKLVIKDNGVIPYQVHLMEMRAILKQAENYLPFLQNSDQYGTVSQKIEKLLSFRIPYYVGPLNANGTGRKFAWVVKKQEGSIYPWNFEEMINEAASAEEFIKRMTKKCTYYTDKEVLPKDSLLYQRYMVLNELNNLKLNYEPITVELKQRIYQDLFQRQKKVTGRQLASYLKKQGYWDSEGTITGIDSDFKTSLGTELELKRIFKADWPELEKLEEAVKAISLFGQAPKLLQERLQKIFPELEASKIKALSQVRCSGWGSLSREFLTEIKGELTDPQTGEPLNIIEAMWHSNENLMELLSKRHTYKKELERQNGGPQPAAKLSYAQVEKLYVSPAVRRQIWQTLTIVQEITQIMGGTPAKIFVEMARASGEKKPTKSRKEKLMELYTSIKKDNTFLWGQLEGTDNDRLRQDRLYLYYTQMGRCMYSGDEIKLSALNAQNEYDVDHIYPKSKIVDNSLDNLVLVKRVINDEKSNDFPIKAEIRQKQQGFWQGLLSKGLISQKKYNRLTRTNGFTEQELADFISRQIVETQQGTKAVAEILRQAFPESKIVYAKANNASRFRQDYGLIKVREMNDYHHAKDAYLNIVVGNIYQVKFTDDPLRYIKGGQHYTLDQKNLLKQDISRNNYTAWQAGEAGTLATVKKYLEKNNILLTQYPTIKRGEFYNQNPLKYLTKEGKEKKTDLIPLKTSDPRLANTKRYGGYTSEGIAYFMLVEHIKETGTKKNPKREAVRSLEGVPIRLLSQLEDHIPALIDYCLKVLKLQEPRILIAKIKLNSLLKINGFPAYITGKTGDSATVKPGVELCIKLEDEQILKAVLKVALRLRETKDKKMLITSLEYDKVDEDNTWHLYQVFMGKLKNSIYNLKLSAQYTTLSENQDNFIKLSVAKRCKVLSEILTMFQCRNSTSDLTEIGGSKNSAKITFPRNLTKAESALLIHNSVTGFFRQEIDLLDPEL